LSRLQNRYNKKRLQSQISLFNDKTGVRTQFYATLYREGLKFPEFFCMGKLPVWFLVKNDFSTSEYKLFFALLACMESENKVVFKSKEFSDQIGISAVSIRKSMEKLKDTNIVFEINRIGTYIKVLKINPHIVWRGSGSEHKEQIKNWPKPKCNKEIPEKFGIL
jgi:hypothetical protein